MEADTENSSYIMNGSVKCIVKLFLTVRWSCLQTLWHKGGATDSEGYIFKSCGGQPLLRM